MCHKVIINSFVIRLYIVFLSSSLSTFLFFQRAHVYLHDWCQLAIHSAHHLPTHLGLHGENSVAAETFKWGRWGNPEPRDWGEWGGSAGWEDSSNQVTQNRWVVDLLSLTKSVSLWDTLDCGIYEMIRPVNFCSAKVADCECWSLLLHCCFRTTAAASPALQGEILTFSLSLATFVTTTFKFSFCCVVYIITFNPLLSCFRLRRLKMMTVMMN